jgi:amino acid transporter
MTSTTTPAPQQLGGSRRLTLVDAVAQSIGFMGPVFSIAFLVPLLVGLNASGNGAGAAAPLSVLIAAIGVLGLGWIVAQYARRIHAAGSLYDYVTDGLGAKVGSASGLLYYAGILALGAGILVMIGGTIHDTIQSEFNRAPLSELAWDVVLFVVLAGVLYLGVALSTRAQLVLALISIAVVLVFSIYVIAKVGGGNHVTKAFTPSSSPQGLRGVLFGVLYGVLLFTGFETAANLGEETENPKRNIPRAVLLSLVVATAFYLIGAYAQMAGYHFDIGAIGKNAGAPLFGLAGPSADGGYGAVAMRRLVELVVIFDMIAVLIGCAVAASRGFFAMARDRQLPAPLARVSGRGTPLTSSAAVLVAYALTIVVTIGWSGFVAQKGLPHYVAVFSFFSTFGPFALSVIYLLMCVGAIRGLRGYAPPARIYLAAAVGIVVTGAALFGSVYKVSAPLIWAPWAALGVMVIGLVAAALNRNARVPATTSFEPLLESEQGPIKL